jgi:hypothetical protein
VHSSPLRLLDPAHERPYQVGQVPGGISAAPLLTARTMLLMEIGFFLNC